MGICRSCFVAPPPLVLLGWWEMRKGRGRDADGRMGRLGGLGGSFFLGYPGFGFFVFGYTVWGCWLCV